MFTDINLGDFVRVIWHDIVAGGGWANTEQTMETHTCESNGYLSSMSDNDEKAKDKKYFITLSATKSTNGSIEYNQHISIPIGVILSVTKL